MKNSLSKRIACFPQLKAKKGDQGVALVLAVLMSVILLGISASLLAKQLINRRNGASESYKQMAETAASNGLNRILAKLNDGNIDNDISYLWRINQVENSKQWNFAEAQLRPLLEQPCSPLLLNSEMSSVLAGGDLSQGLNLRDDGGAEAVAMRYKLRSYAVSSNQATFEVEGIVTRGNTATAPIEARSLLTRMLALQNRVPDADHWGAMAASKFNLGPSTIIGPGKALLLLRKATDGASFATPGACSATTLGSLVSATDLAMQAKIWPVLDQDLPSPGIFDQQVSVDQITPAGSSTLQRRIWNIDDTRSSTNNPLAGCSSIICTRGEQETRYKSQDLIYLSSSNITLPGAALCADQQAKPCLLWIEKIKLAGSKKLLIASNQAVVLRMFRPLESISIVSPSILCAANSGETSCRQEPDRLAIVANGGDSPVGCATATQKLSITGNALPAALVLMPQGTVEANSSASIRGLIWAQQICAPGGIKLTTTTMSGANIVDNAKATWLWSDDLVLGATTTKGIRGTGLDLFRRW